MHRLSRSARAVEVWRHDHLLDVFDDGALASGAQEALVEAGCDGAGLDLETAPLLPRSDTLGVKTNRDTLTESGDDDLADYGADEFSKNL